MSELAQLKNEVSEIRKEMQVGFDEIRSWMRSADTGMKGNEEYEIWGYQQKINYNKEKLDKQEARVTALENKFIKVFGWVAGAGAAAGALGGVIVILVQILIGG